MSAEKELEKIAISAFNKYIKWLEKEKEKRELELKEKIIKLQIR